LTEVTLTRDGQGVWFIRGDLEIATVAGVLAQSRPMLECGQAAIINMSGVKRVDSGALALMLEFIRESAQHGTRIRFTEPPSQLRAIAEACGVTDILSF
jgi:anti-anti-sigma factor